MDKYIEKMENAKEIEQLVNEEYSANIKSLMAGKEMVENCLKEDKEDGFDKSYFSTKVTFSKQTKEVREVAINSAFIRMLAFKKLLQEQLGCENVEVNTLEFDNHTTYVRAIVTHK